MCIMAPFIFQEVHRGLSIRATLHQALLITTTIFTSALLAAATSICVQQAALPTNQN